MYVLNAGMNYVVTYWGHMLGINIETDMRKKLYDHIQKLSFRFFDNAKTGNLLSRLTNDLMEIGEVAHHGPEDLFIAVMTLAGAFCLMYSINEDMAILTFLVIPLMIYFVGFRRYLEILETAPDITDASDAIEVEKLRGG